jgi:hypothetical protein
LLTIKRSFPFPSSAWPGWVHCSLVRRMNDVVPPRTAAILPPVVPVCRHVFKINYCPHQPHVTPAPTSAALHRKQTTAATSPNILSVAKICSPIPTAAISCLRQANVPQLWTDQMSCITSTSSVTIPKSTRSKAWVRPLHHIERSGSSGTLSATLPPRPKIDQSSISAQSSCRSAHMQSRHPLGLDRLDLPACS